MTTLAASDHLGAVVAAVQDAGCEVMPAWANGALMLVPTTMELAMEEGWQPERFHILVKDEDLESLANALREFPRGGLHRGKPGLRSEEGVPIGTVCYLNLHEQVDRWLEKSRWKLHEDRTFVDVRPDSCSGSSEARAQSAEARISGARSSGYSELVVPTPGCDPPQ